MALTDNLEAYWAMDESADGSSAVTRADSTANNRDLSDESTTPSGTGKIDNAVDLELSDGDYLEHADNAVFDFDASWAIAGWVNLETLASNSGHSPTIASKDGGSTGWTLRIGGDNDKLDFLIGDSSPRYQPTTAFDSTGTWYHFVVTSDDTDIQIYINGSLELDTTFEAVSTNTSALRIGNSSKYNTRFLDGLLDEMGVWSRQLTAQEASDLYNNGNGLAYPFVLSTRRVFNIT